MPCNPLLLLLLLLRCKGPIPGRCGFGSISSAGTTSRLPNLPACWMAGRCLPLLPPPLLLLLVLLSSRVSSSSWSSWQCIPSSAAASLRQQHTSSSNIAQTNSGSVSMQQSQQCLWRCVVLSQLADPAGQCTSLHTPWLLKACMQVSASKQASLIDNTAPMLPLTS